MLFQPWWLSIVPFRIPHMFLLLHNRCLCILNSLSCHCSLSINSILNPFLCFFVALKIVFPVVSPPKASFQMVSCSLLPMLWPFLPPSHSCLCSLDDVAGRISATICHIYPPGVAKGSFSDHWPLYLVLTLLLGEMLDVARYGPHGG